MSICWLVMCTWDTGAGLQVVSAPNVLQIVTFWKQIRLQRFPLSETLQWFCQNCQIAGFSLDDDFITNFQCTVWVNLSFCLQMEMVRTRNVQCLSFPLTVSTLLTSTSWVLYGLQLSDCYIVVRRARPRHMLCNRVPPSAKPVVSNSLCFSSSPVFMKPQAPNLPGIITSLIRFFLFWKFGSTKQNSPSYTSLKIWGGRKRFLSSGQREASVIGPVNSTKTRLECNTLPPNNRCWESTLVFCSLKYTSFVSQKWTFLLVASVVSRFFFLSISCLLAKIHIRGQKWVSCLRMVGDTQKSFGIWDFLFLTLAKEFVEIKVILL